MLLAVYCVKDRWGTCPNADRLDPHCVLLNSYKEWLGFRTLQASHFLYSAARRSAQLQRKDPWSQKAPRFQGITSLCLAQPGSMWRQAHLLRYPVLRLRARADWAVCLGIVISLPHAEVQ